MLSCLYVCDCCCANPIHTKGNENKDIDMLHLIAPDPSLSLPCSPAEVRGLWTQLRRDEPHLLSNFEDFLARVTSQIKEADQEKREMESALQRSGQDIFVHLII